MKKISLLLVLMCSIFMSGCIKNYKTVDDYSEAMDSVKNKVGSYTIEAKYKNSYAEMYYKGYFKGNKWKTQMSMNGGQSYITTVMYDGNDLLSFNEWSKIAVTNPISNFVRGLTPEEIQDMINSQNPLNVVYNWQNEDIMTSIIHRGDDSNKTFANNKDKKNGFGCRTIRFGDYKEVCISDKYGVAVYHKIVSEYRGKKEQTEINVVSIDTSKLDDSVFDLPKGIEKKDALEVMKEMPKMLDEMRDGINNMKK